MTLLVPADNPVTGPLTWALADTDFWVANNPGAFGGTIDHFYLRVCFGHYLGDYATLNRAQHQLELHLAAAAA